MKRSCRWCALAILAIVPGPVAFDNEAAAQTSNATLQGIIADTSGAVLPGVTVKLESPSTGLSRDVVTNTSGVYVFNFLPAGGYVVAAELSGFKTRRATIRYGSRSGRTSSSICAWRSDNSPKS